MDLERKEEQLKKRLEKIEAMEAQIREREKALKTKELSKKQVPLRLSSGLWNKIAAWAEEDFRSINGQIEYLLTKAVNEKYKD